MTSSKTLKTIEYDKIKQILSGFAVLESSKKFLLDFMPLDNITDCKYLLDETEEAYSYLYKYSLSGIYYFADVSEVLDRADKGGVLNNVELLRVGANLKSARILKEGVLSVNDENLKYLPQLASGLYYDSDFEKELFSKIISEDEVSDNASEKLYKIRKNIRSLNAKIRERLNSYIHGGLNKYLQDAVITMRSQRYVIPVKSEYRSFVKGFIHDQSSTGSTVFIEPAEIMELNNELRRAGFEEVEEIKQILTDLSRKIASISQSLRYNAEILRDFDCAFARAEYAFKTKSTKPLLNNKGYINIKRGRHPLIAPEKVVPIDLIIGKDFNFLLLSGPNTGGKTVTMKLVGLFTLMAMSGLYLPADDSTEISFFNGVFCDIGDEQSIENDVSTFSSHIKNIINILENVDTKCLVLIDELGTGTAPEEGSALALAIIKDLLEKSCFGIITTHYSKLKEYAMENSKIENASMEFDTKTLRPLYKLVIGIPGSSNAIEIAKTLGISQKIIDDALNYISDETIGFEKVLKKAEESRILADEKVAELNKLSLEKQAELEVIKSEKEKIVLEREKIHYNAKQETKRIVSDKLAEAEEIIYELKDILKRANLESKEVIRASELKNRLNNSKYLENDNFDAPYTLVPCQEKDLIKGNRVYIKSLNNYGIINEVKRKNKEIEILIGEIKTIIKPSDLFNAEKPVKKENKVKVFNSTALNYAVTEINVIGKDSIEALDLVKQFIDQAVLRGLEEIKVIHGVGMGVLLKTIRDYLKTDKNVLEFRRGKYGEGENGVTIIKLK